MRVTLKALQYFLTATERGSLTRAAEELHVVPSAVAAAIDLVEDEFGMKLVTRTPSKGITATANGHILLAKTRHLLEEYNNLMAEGSELRTALSGTLCIGYYAPMAPAFMPAIAAQLMQQNTDVSVRFVECDNESAQSGLLAGDFDAILFVAENVKPGIAYEVLQEAPPYLLTAAGHRLAKRKSVDFTELENEPLVLLDLPVVSAYYRSIFDKAGLTPRIVASTTSAEMARSLVASGSGSAVLNMRPLCDVSYGGDGLAAVPILPSVQPLKLVLGYLKGNPRRLVRAFVDECLVYFAGTGAEKLIVKATD